MAPELREGCGEFPVPHAGTLPSRIDLSQLGGDVHVPATVTDGRRRLKDRMQARPGWLTKPGVLNTRPKQLRRMLHGTMGHCSVATGS
jgi:hypothetical protein